MPHRFTYLQVRILVQITIYRNLYENTGPGHKLILPTGITYCTYISKYCTSGNIREVSIFANFARGTNSRIPLSRENYYYNSATKEK